MEITSFWFASLAIVSLFLYYLSDQKYRIPFLLLLSCGFILTYSYWLLIYIIVYSVINYYIGIKLALSGHKKALFRVGVIINLLQLILLRYSSFTFDPVINVLNFNFKVSVLSEIIVPVGISFFTLQSIGYLINIKMGWEKPEKDFLHFLLYITFSPKFLSGPIERSNHFLPQLNKRIVFDEQKISEGLRLILFGLFKKIAIANQLAPFVHQLYTNSDMISSHSVWLVILIQPLYLYFDFSGYTDIAVGTARLFGIDLLPNFNRPFLSENVTAFWKRMHMSLSLWFNDYVFRQLSFRNRKWGIYSSVFAVFVTFTLFGIWHGAGWTFMILGFLQALAINYEFFTKKWRISVFSTLPQFYRKWTGRVVTYLFFAYSHIFFFSPDLNTAMEFISNSVKFNGPVLTGIRSEIFIVVLFFMVVFLVFEVFKNDYENAWESIEKKWLSAGHIQRIFRWALYFGMITVIMVFKDEVQQFIYFQF